MRPTSRCCDFAWPHTHCSIAVASTAGLAVQSGTLARLMFMQESPAEHPVFPPGRRRTCRRSVGSRIERTSRVPRSPRLKLRVAENPHENQKEHQ